jgi:phosphoglycolate phosphatase-like HAD superfamily hydrolase
VHALNEPRFDFRPIEHAERRTDMRVVFDVDGTLVQSVSLDTELYDRAFLETFGVRLPSTDWSTYENATDSGIVREAVSRLGLPRERIRDMRQRFIDLVSQLPALEPVAGVHALLRELRRRDVRLGIATGGWAPASRYKLNAAHVDVSGLPLVGSDDFFRREDILRTVIERVGGGGEVTYVGDGPWDAAASKNLGIGFIGICRDGQLGPRAIPDFADTEAFFQLLRSR